MDEAVFVALRLSRAGYGRPTQILNEPTDIVRAMIAFERFTHELEETVIEINREDVG